MMESILAARKLVQALRAIRMFEWANLTNLVVSFQRLMRRLGPQTRSQRLVLELMLEQTLARRLDQGMWNR